MSYANYNILSEFKLQLAHCSKFYLQQIYTFTIHCTCMHTCIFCQLIQHKSLINRASREFKIPSNHVISGLREFGDITSSCVSYRQAFRLCRFCHRASLFAFEHENALIPRSSPLTSTP